MEKFLEDAKAAWPRWSAICPADYTEEQFLKHYENLYLESIAHMTDKEYSEFVTLRCAKNVQRLGDILDSAQKYKEKHEKAKAYQTDKFTGK